MLDREKVGKALLEQRKIKGMTQKQLASLLNVSYQAVSRWEQGISLPSVDMIYNIAQVLDTTVDSLLSGFSGERKSISYMDTGLDTKKIHMVKDRLADMITQDDRLFYTNIVTAPVFFKPDLIGMEEPVCSFALHVPGSKERFAMKNGYDREICMDLVANASNNLMRFGVRPSVLLANVVCGNNDSSQLLLMGESMKEACENDGILFAGLGVAAQAVNYPANEYKIGAVVFGISDRKDIITGSEIAEGDVLIGLHTAGISSLSYPFIKVILDRKPEIINTKFAGENTFIDELMRPNTSYVNIINKLNRQKLIHGIFIIRKSLLDKKSYVQIPEGLEASISFTSIQMPPLFQYIFDLNMMDRECFLKDFSLGIGMLLAVPEKYCDKVLKIIKKHHKCYCLGKIEKDIKHLGERVWIV